MWGVGGTYALFGKRFGELADFSAPLAPAGASALDVSKAALSAGQSNGVVRAFSLMKEG